MRKDPTWKPECALWRATAIGLAGLAIAACQPPRPQSQAPETVTPSAAEIRSASAEDQGVIEVQPLRDPVVIALERRATGLEAEGDLDGALRILEQAAEIAPDDPRLLQRIAELSLEQGRWEVALTTAIRAYELGPKIGSLCARSLRTIDAARERLGEAVAARDYQVCQVQPRETF